MKKNTALKDILSDRTLRQYAGRVYYERGVEYFETNSVSDIFVEPQRVSAKVHGNRTYRVVLRNDDGELSFSCTCPLFKREGEFCKHCVCVGLAYLQEASESPLKKKGGTREQKPLEAIKTYLQSQDKNALISLIFDHAVENDALQERLLLRAAKTGKNIDISTFRRAINHAVAVEDYVDYTSMYDYSRGIDETVESIRELLSEGHAEKVIELTEYFLQLLEEQIGMTDDSDGYLGGILDDLQELHHAACVKAQPDPEKLAEKLFRWEMNSDWDVFYGAAKKYANLFGKKGMKVYRSLAEKEWGKVRPLKPGEEKDSFQPHRFHITSVMETLASRSNDLESLVSIKSKDLSSAYNFLEIAEIYRKAHKPDKALEWAEKGLKAFPNDTDSRLRIFLADEYHRRKRHDEAMQLMWAEFREHYSLENFKLLKSHAEKCEEGNVWAGWREKSLAFVRDSIAGQKAESAKRRYTWSTVDHSDLVRIFLWEKDEEQAWHEAQEDGCEKELWLKLAAIRETDHPEDTLAVYQRLLDPTIEGKHHQAYTEAIEFLKKVRRLMMRLHRERQWEMYIEKVFTDHRRKRNFIAMLEKLRRANTIDNSPSVEKLV